MKSIVLKDSLDVILFAQLVMQLTEVFDLFGTSLLVVGVKQLLYGMQQEVELEFLVGDKVFVNSMSGN